MKDSGTGSSNEVCDCIHILLPRETSWSPYHYLSSPQSCVMAKRSLFADELPASGRTLKHLSSVSADLLVSSQSQPSTFSCPGHPSTAWPLFCPFRPPPSLRHSWPLFSLSSFSDSLSQMLSLGIILPHTNPPSFRRPASISHVLVPTHHQQPSQQGSSQLARLPKPTDSTPPMMKATLLHILGSPGCHMAESQLLVSCLSSAWHCLLPDTVSWFSSQAAPFHLILVLSFFLKHLGSSWDYILGSPLADLAHLRD